jgi:hypothetical protein
LLPQLNIGLQSLLLIIEHLAHHPRQLHKQGITLLLLLLLLAHDFGASLAAEWTCLVDFGPLVDTIVAEWMQARLYRDLDLLVKTDLAEVTVLLLLFNLGFSWRHLLFLLIVTGRLLFIICGRLF